MPYKNFITQTLQPEKRTPFIPPLLFFFGKVLTKIFVIKLHVGYIHFAKLQNLYLRLVSKTVFQLSKMITTVDWYESTHVQ